MEASQFESAYKPKSLGNWEVPKLNNERPERRIGGTNVISNSRGHLLPTIQRSHSNPWGEYVGTWQLPKKIDRKTANQLSGFSSQKLRKAKEEKINDLCDKEIDKENIDNNSAKTQPYVPGDLTEDKYRLSSHDDLIKKIDEESKSPKFPTLRDDFFKPMPQPEKDLTKEVEDFCKLNREMIDTHPNPATDVKKKGRLLSPILAAISNFNLAKKLHKENLEHNPLPDTITERMFRKLQLQRQEELALEEKPFATGVAWKGYPGYGPNRCTKMKVYRPKTCGYIKANQDEECISSFDRKWRFIRQSKVTPMDLAICWDMSPADPQDEPKRTTHIDGSNGSAAPAVFSLVHTPKGEDEEPTPKCDGIHGCGPLFEQGTKETQAKEYFFHRVKNGSIGSKGSDSTTKQRAKSAHDSNSVKSGDSEARRRAISANCRSNADKQSVRSKESLSSTKSRARSAYNLNEIKKTSPKLQECNNNELYKNVHHSTPNLCEKETCLQKNSCKHSNRLPNNRLCVGCEMKKMSISEKRPKSEYKMAFKAGLPQKNKARRQEYPEHWRLATVYQHSYKPIHTRKRPLLQTVYK